MHSFKFGRLLKGDTPPGFVYNENKGEESDWSPRATAMQDVGTHWQVTIRNYMREDAIIVNSLRSNPIKIASVYSYDKYMLQDTTNFVIIELKMRENEKHKDGSGKVKSTRKIEIRCPGHYLQNHSLFIEELGCYLTVASRLQATKECIAQDSRFPDSKTIDIPETAVTPDPVCTLSDYEPLVRNCIERADRIQVRVGVKVDVDQSRLAAHIKSMRIAVMDHYFSPYQCNRMVYDPSLNPNEFAVENLHWMTSEPLYGKFEDLEASPDRAFFVDTQEHHTLGGTLCGLVIFSDEAALHDYLFRHRAKEVYEDLLLRVSEQNGNHALAKRIDALTNILETRDTTIEELREQLKFEKNQTKEYKTRATTYEETIKNIRNHQEDANSYNAIMVAMANERKELDLKRERLEYEERELERKLAISADNARSAKWKSLAEILKSGWGIILAAITVGTAILKGYNKLSSSTV